MHSVYDEEFGLSSPLTAEVRFVDDEINLILFVFLFKFRVHVLKVTRGITLAPHEIHPYH